MDDFDVAKEDTEGRIQLDPSVWAPKPAPTNPFSLYQSPDFLRHHMHQYAMPVPIQQQSMMQQQNHQQQNHQQHQMNSLLESLQSGMVSFNLFICHLCG